MIKFFRHIRQQLLTENRFRKYLIYAIGEIVLVVVGILIALSINNWNENQKQNDQIVKYAKALVQDLEKDIKMIDTIYNTSKQISIRIDSLSAYVRNSKLEDLSNLDVICLTWVRLYRPYSWNQATLEEIKNSGSLRLINNEEISNRIVKYDAQSKHMEDDYYEDKEQSEDANKLLDKLVNYNYPNMTELAEMLRLTTNYGRIHESFDNPIYKEAQGFDLRLNLEDPNLINNVVNSFIRLKYLLSIRTQIELPALIQNAQELIDLLKEEYMF
ncbi:MAG: hypothetical protein HKN40_06815 [Winogradskyella sp.]|uniref:DUF6090 family protein n=1 Tax=Winogradskyella sp. TaxID=1883156 RepID=UPI0017ECBAAE|nr:hypothetical protein [Winogradskyella sp.]